MRNTFIKQLVHKANGDTFLMVGDVGYSVVEPFVEKYPSNFLNTGVAEQNMTGMAAGLALAGYKVFTYSIANFNTIRCLEQIRNDICYHDLDVTVISVGGGFVYGSAGYSHHAVQDIAMLGSLPNMTLFLPADAKETEFSLEVILKTKGPKYLRLGKNGEKSFYKEKGVVQKINRLTPKEGAKIAIISVGTILPVSFEVRDLLKKKGISLAVFSCTVIDVSFKKNIQNALRGFDHIVTIEEHIVDFGFGSLVRNTFQNQDVHIQSFGADKDLCNVVGSQTFLRAKHGLDAQSIAKGILLRIKKSHV